MSLSIKQRNAIRCGTACRTVLLLVGALKVYSASAFVSREEPLTKCILALCISCAPNQQALRAELLQRPIGVNLLINVVH